MKILLSLVAALLVMQQAAACGCSKPKSVRDLRYPSIAFRGEVVLVAKYGGPLSRRMPGEAVTFKVLEQYQGPKMNSVVVEFNEPGFSSCDLERLRFEVGDVYLISSLLDDTGGGNMDGKSAQTPFTNNYCNLRERLSQAREK